MKTTQFIGFIIILFLPFSGCSKVDMGVSASFPDHYHYYWLTISFRDAAGKDLIVPLAEEKWKMEEDKDLQVWPGTINPERYNLDIVLSNPHQSWDNTIYNFKATKEFIPDIYRPYFTIAKFNEQFIGTLTYCGEEDSIQDGYCYLFSQFILPAINGVQEYLTYKITCPTLFGDNSIHEIVTFWNKNQLAAQQIINKQMGDLYPECIKAFFDGNEVSVKKAVVHSTNTKDYYSYFIDIVLDK